MPFAYLRKQRVAEERARARGRRDGGAERGLSVRGAMQIALLAGVVVPVLVYLPWMHSALGPGGRLPDWWLRTSQEEQAECWTVDSIPEAHEGFRFCEDIERIPGAHALGETVLISCDANRAGWNTVMGPLTDASPRGRLFTYEYPTSPTPRESKAIPVDLLDFPTEHEFHPLGISIVEPSAPHPRVWRLFVINHRKLRSTIEVFDLSPTSTRKRNAQRRWVAHWQRSIVHPLATHTPNSIHALSATSLVVTNDHLFARRAGPLASHTIPLLSHLLFGKSQLRQAWKRWVVEMVARLVVRPSLAVALAQLETLLGLPLGWVTFVQFDAQQYKQAAKSSDETGVSAKILASAIPFANGVVLTPDHNALIVASTTYPGIWMYDILPPPSSTHPFGNQTRLKLQSKLHLPFRVDNLSFSAPNTSSASLTKPRHADVFSGRKLVATGHPAPLQLMAMAKDPSAKTSPSWSVAISPYIRTSPKESPGAIHAELWEDNDAELPAHHFTLSHNPDWLIRTLVQSNGSTLNLGQHQVKLASSASSFYHPYPAAQNAGTLLVSGLYANVVACTNVGT